MIIIYYYEIDMKDDNDFDGDGWLKYWRVLLALHKIVSVIMMMKKLVMVIMRRSDGWVWEYEN